MEPTEAFLQALALASLGAAGLILVILALRRLVGSASARWRMVLWTVLVLRMALGWVAIPNCRLTLPDRLSSHHLAPGRLDLAPAPVPLAEVPSRPRPRPFPWATLCFGLWALGALALLARLLHANFSLWRAIRRGRVLTHQPTLDLLERCKDDLRVRTVLGIVVTERVPSPALFGLLRPRLLLPAQVLETLPPEGLRHVFLHELVHLKRWDILAAWAGSILQVIHWFNPLVWLGFRRMRSDREIACDEGALGLLSPSERTEYGRTLLLLQELLAAPSPLPSLAGVVEETSTFTWRIKMIANFKHIPGLRPWSPLSIGLLGMFTLGAFSFSFALHGENGVPSALAQPIQDKVDYPFVDDPEVIGTWRARAFVKSPEDFVPGKATPRDAGILAKWEKEMPFMVPFSVRPGGRTSSAQTWTKGLFLYDNGGEQKTASRYQIKSFDGADYLLQEFKNGDYTYRGMPPEWVAFQRESRIPAPPSRTVDKVDYPFMDDPQLLGTWHTVDYVKSPEAFHPGSMAWKWGDLQLKALTFLPNGKTDTGFTWTNGLVLHRGQKTASRYSVRSIDGHPYLFMEWKSGDYTIRGMKPEYYVLAR
jgi:bla regulator protein BlaR1